MSLFLPKTGWRQLDWPLRVQTVPRPLSAMPGTQAGAEAAQTQSCVSPSVPAVQLLSVLGRHIPTAPGAVLSQAWDNPSPPPHPQPCTNPTATLSAACALCSRTRTMLQAEKVLELFQRCCGKSCTPMASMCELHPTLVPISLQRSHLTACAAPPCAAAPPWPGKYTPQF